MKREIVINASTLEVRVALLEDGVLTEFHLERNERRGWSATLQRQGYPRAARDAGGVR